MLIVLIILMEQSQKKTNNSFLDKFKGRTSKVDKSGLANALTSEKNIPQQDSQNSTRHRPRKLISLDPRSSSQNYGASQAQKEGVTLGSPDLHQMLPALSKRGTNPNIMHKPDPLPLLYSPLLPKDSRQLPPSRSISLKSQNQQGRIFGKYLKLDQEAMRHFQFLLQLQRGKGRRASLAQR